MQPDIVVFAIGNPSRGDDALGPWLLERLSSWLADQPWGGRFDLVEDFQLQVEHCLDLEDRQLALFIDAGSGTPAPWSLQPVGPDPSLSHTSHALEPGAVLQVYQKTLGKVPPPSFVLCVRGECFELGEPLSAQAQVHGESAWELLTTLCRQPDPLAWTEQVQ